VHHYLTDVKSKASAAQPIGMRGERLITELVIMSTLRIVCPFTEVATVDWSWFQRTVLRLRGRRYLSAVIY